MTELEQYIQTYFGLSEENLASIANQFTTHAISKNDYFVQSGQYCKRLSFIKEGYFRIFDYKEGKEITQWISSKGEFVTDLSSMIFSTPARWNIQALEDAVLYSLSKEDYDQLGSHIPQWDKLEKLFIAKCFLTLEDRVFSFLSMTAEQRFQHLFQYKPELFNLVPLHYLASMLGMTPETLSRIRKKSIL